MSKEGVYLDIRTNLEINKMDSETVSSVKGAISDKVIVCYLFLYYVR